MILKLNASVDEIREHLSSSIEGIRSTKNVTPEAKRRAVAKEFAVAVKRRDAIVGQRSKIHADEVNALRQRLLGPGVGRLASPAERVAAAASLRDAAARVDDVTNGDALIRLIDRAAAHGDTHLIVAAAGAAFARRDAVVLNKALEYLDPDGRDEGWQRLWDVNSQHVRDVDLARQSLRDHLSAPDELAGMSIYSIEALASSDPDPAVAAGPAGWPSIGDPPTLGDAA